MSHLGKLPRSPCVQLWWKAAHKVFKRSFVRTERFSSFLKDVFQWTSCSDTHKLMHKPIVRESTCFISVSIQNETCFSSFFRTSKWNYFSLQSPQVLYKGWKDCYACFTEINKFTVSYFCHTCLLSESCQMSRNLVFTFVFASLATSNLNCPKYYSSC